MTDALVISGYWLAGYLPRRAPQRGQAEEPRPAMMLSDGTPAKVGDEVQAEPPRGATVVDRAGVGWFHYGWGWVPRDTDPAVLDAPLPWPLLRDLYGPMRLA